MQPPPDTNASPLIKVGVIALAAAMLAGGWELLALQMPGSPLYIGVLPGPVRSLRELCVTLGLLTLAAASLMPRAYAGCTSRRAAVVPMIMAIGVALSVATQTYGALNGMHGVQMQDLRADAQVVFFVRSAGLLLYALAWLDLGLRVLRHRLAPT